MPTLHVKYDIWENPFRFVICRSNIHNELISLKLKRKYLTMKHNINIKHLKY